MNFLALSLIGITLGVFPSLAQADPDAGTEMGNGNFAYKYADSLLTQAVQGLRALHGELGLAPAQSTILDSSLANLKRLPSEERFRMGYEPLLFDYGRTEDACAPKPGPCLIATKFFYSGYTSTFVTGPTPELLVDISRRLLHEASHLWGLNEVDAENLSRNTNLDSLLSFFASKASQKEGPNLVPFVGLKFVEQTNYAVQPRSELTFSVLNIGKPTIKFRYQFNDLANSMKLNNFSSGEMSPVFNAVTGFYELSSAMSYYDGIHRIICKGALGFKLLVVEGDVSELTLALKYAGDPMLESNQNCKQLAERTFSEGVRLTFLPAIGAGRKSGRVFAKL